VSLDKTVITSPISGIVIARNVDVGQTVAASLQAPTLFVVAADLTKMQVDASVHEADVGQVQPGQKATFRVDAFPSEEFLGTVALVRLDPIVQQNVVTYSTLIDVPNADLKLKPGMTATVSIRTAERRNVLRVPNGALRFRPGADLLARVGAGRAVPVAGATASSTNEPGTAGMAWVLDAGRLSSRRLVLGISDDNYTELVRGDLEEGALVVTSALVSGAAATPASSSATNPLMGPQRGGPTRGGGR
jgi:HlyD family secretion protein